MLLGDEISLAAPALLAGISRRATYARRSLLKLDVKKSIEEPFGRVLLQVLAGDFLQLNPVANHTLMAGSPLVSKSSWTP